MDSKSTRKSAEDKWLQNKEEEDRERERSLGRRREEQRQAVDRYLRGRRATSASQIRRTPLTNSAYYNITYTPQRLTQTAGNGGEHEVLDMVLRQHSERTYHSSRGTNVPLEPKSNEATLTTRLGPEEDLSSDNHSPGYLNMLATYPRLSSAAGSSAQTRLANWRTEQTIIYRNNNDFLTKYGSPVNLPKSETSPQLVPEAASEGRKKSASYSTPQQKQSGVPSDLSSHEEVSSVAALDLVEPKHAEPEEPETAPEATENEEQQVAVIPRGILKKESAYTSSNQELSIVGSRSPTVSLVSSLPSHVPHFDTHSLHTGDEKRLTLQQQHPHHSTHHNSQTLYRSTSMDALDNRKQKKSVRFVEERLATTQELVEEDMSAVKRLGQKPEHAEVDEENRTPLKEVATALERPEPPGISPSIFWNANNATQQEATEAPVAPSAATAAVPRFPRARPMSSQEKTQSVSSATAPNLYIHGNGLTDSKESHLMKPPAYPRTAPSSQQQVIQDNSSIIAAPSGTRVISTSSLVSTELAAPSKASRVPGPSADSTITVATTTTPTVTYKLPASGRIIRPYSSVTPGSGSSRMKERRRLKKSYLASLQSSTVNSDNGATVAPVPVGGDNKDKRVVLAVGNTEQDMNELWDRVRTYNHRQHSAHHSRVTSANPSTKVTRLEETTLRTSSGDPPGHYPRQGVGTICLPVADAVDTPSELSIQSAPTNNGPHRPTTATHNYPLRLASAADSDTSGVSGSLGSRDTDAYRMVHLVGSGQKFSTTRPLNWRQTHRKLLKQREDNAAMLRQVSATGDNPSSNVESNMTNPRSEDITSVGTSETIPLNRGTRDRMVSSAFHHRPVRLNAWESPRGTGASSDSPINAAPSTAAMASGSGPTDPLSGLYTKLQLQQRVAPLQSGALSTSAIRRHNNHISTL